MPCLAGTSSLRFWRSHWELSLSSCYTLRETHWMSRVLTLKHVSEASGCHPLSGACVWEYTYQVLRVYFHESARSRRTLSWSRRLAGTLWYSFKNGSFAKSNIGFLSLSSNPWSLAVWRVINLFAFMKWYDGVQSCLLPTADHTCWKILQAYKYNARKHIYWSVAYRVEFWKKQQEL